MNTDSYLRTQALLMELRDWALKYKVTTVPPGLAMEFMVGDETYSIEGSEPMWMKKDSGTDFYITLESQSVQLNFSRAKTGVITVKHKALGAPARRMVRLREGIDQRATFN